MKRRQFLQQVIPASALFPSLVNGFNIKAFGAGGFFESLAGAADNDHVFVIIQLSGGNDGLNTFIPLSNYSDYYGMRSNIAIPEANVLRLSGYSKAGLHPSMKGMQQLYNEDKLAVLFSVGYPEPSGSHFRATDIWLTGADANQTLTTGWAGRFLNNSYENYPSGYPNAKMPDPLAIQIGSVISPAFMGPGGFTAMATPTDINFYGLINGITDSVPDSPMGNELTYLRTVARQTNKYADVITAAAAKAGAQSAYPDYELAAQLKTVARLISGGLKTKVYMVSMGGFDTHGNQVQSGNPLIGTHARNLQQVSESITAFQNDLKQLGVSKRVAGMTFSEFGRRIRSNGSLGTDHGAAQPVFLFGEAVKQGVLGNPPDLPSATDSSASLPMQYDFRSVYATVLRDWFCVAPTDVSSLLYKDYQYLPLMEATACAVPVVKEPDTLGENLLKVSPNPFVDSVSITFQTAGGNTVIQIFDSAGRLVAVPVNTAYAAGTYTETFYGGHLSAGVYYARLQNAATQQVKTMIKAPR